jgi:hypothetical protein
LKHKIGKIPQNWKEAQYWIQRGFNSFVFI